MALTFAHASREIWGSAQAHSDIGGVAIIVCKRLLKHAKVGDVGGRASRASAHGAARWERQLMHKHGIDAEVMQGVVAVYDGEAAKCAAGPRRHLFVPAGDRRPWRHPRAWRRIQPRRRASRVPAAQVHERLGRDLPGVSDAHSGGRLSWLDRFYTALPTWMLVAMQAGCGLHTAPDLLYAKGVSDHGAVHMTPTDRR